MIYYDDFRAFAKEHEDEIFEYFVRDGEDAAQYGTIMEVVPLPDADFLIGFNAWTACYNDKDFRLYQQDDLEYYKLERDSSEYLSGFRSSKSTANWIRIKRG